MLNQDTVRWLRRLARLAENPIIARLHELEQVTKMLNRLAGQTCAGRVHWRDRNAPGKTPKMVIVHGIDQACPLHGTPEAGKRLRIYVGTDEERQEVAVAAIQDEEKRQKLQQRKEGIERALHRCGYNLRQAYECLGYTVPRPDQPALYPEPYDRWEPPLRW
jgi:hypothetical protein